MATPWAFASTPVGRKDCLTDRPLATFGASATTARTTLVHLRIFNMAFSPFLNVASTIFPHVARDAIGPDDQGYVSDSFGVNRGQATFVLGPSAESAPAATVETAGPGPTRYAAAAAQPEDRRRPARGRARPGRDAAPARALVASPHKAADALVFCKDNGEGDDYRGSTAIARRST